MTVGLTEAGRAGNASSGPVGGEEARWSSRLLPSSE